MATQRTRYANTDVSGGAGDGTSLANAYSSMSALEAAEDDLGNLVSRDEWLDVLVYATSGTADTTKCIWSGWTLDSTRYIKISCPQTKSATWSTSIYRLSVSNDDALSFQSAGRFDVEDLQVEITGGDNTNDEVVGCTYVAAAVTINLKRVFARGGTDSICTCFSFTDSDVTFNMESCIGQAGHASGRASYFVACTGYMYHCTFYGGASGFRSGTTGTFTLTNCMIGETSDDFIVGAGSTVTIDHCCSDDGDGTNAIDPGVGGVIGAMTDPANGDFTIDADSVAYHAGADLSVTLDYISASFHSTTPSVGAFEYVGGGDTELVVADIDIGLDVAMDTNALTASCTVAVNEIDIGLDVAMDSNPITAACTVAPEDIDIGLGVTTGSITLTYNSSGDTVLIVDDMRIALDLSYDSLVAQVTAALAVDSIDIGLGITLDEVPSSGKPTTITISAEAKTISIAAVIKQITIEAEVS